MADEKLLELRLIQSRTCNGVDSLNLDAVTADLSNSESKVRRIGTYKTLKVTHRLFNCILKARFYYNSNIIRYLSFKC